MFQSARLKITTLYVLIIMLITFVFSTIVYVNVNIFSQRALEMHERRVENRIREFRGPANANFPPNFQRQISQEALSQIKKNTIYTLSILNVIVLITSGGVAYWFAGRTLKPIEEMTMKQNQFIADAAHELKTPLAAMRINLEINKRAKKLNKKQVDTLIDSTIEDIDHLTLFTTNLLKQSKYQNYNSKIDYEQFDIKELALETIKRQSGKINSKNINVKVELDEIKIKANKENISELLTILIDNAIKFNNKNGEIKIKGTLENKSLSLEISDTGVGIAKKDIPYIFDRFYKTDSSRTKNEQDGFGLGLSIAQDLVKAHRGTIIVKSDIGKGTTFKIKLPIQT